jgi:sRNA-binding protein
MVHNSTARAAVPVIEKLAERFPAVFVADKWQPHKPLAHGIRDQIRAACPEIGRRKVCNALYFYVGRLIYREALIAGATRIDIDGQVVGEVSPQEAHDAAERVAIEKARRDSQAASLSGLKLAAQAGQKTDRRGKAQ